MARYEELLSLAEEKHKGTGATSEQEAAPAKASRYEELLTQAEQKYKYSAAERRNAFLDFTTTAGGRTTKQEAREFSSGINAPAIKAAKEAAERQSVALAEAAMTPAEIEAKRNEWQAKEGEAQAEYVKAENNYNAAVFGNPDVPISEQQASELLQLYSNAKNALDDAIRNKSKYDRMLTIAKRNSKTSMWAEKFATVPGATDVQPVPTDEELFAYDQAMLNPEMQLQQNGALPETPIKNDVAFYFANRDSYDPDMQNSTEKTRVMDRGRSGNWDYMTETEQATYNGVLLSEGKQRANEYLNDLQPTLNKRATEDITASQREMFDKASPFGKIAYSVGTVPLNLLGSIPAFVSDAVNTVQGKDIDPNDRAHLLQTSAENIRSWRADEHRIIGESLARVFGLSDKTAKAVGKTVSMTYNGVMSALDSAASLATGTALAGALGAGANATNIAGRLYEVSMSMGAAANRAKELYNAGLPRDQVAIGAVGSGIIEAVFEHISIDKLVENFVNGETRSFTDLVKKTLVQAGVEGSEEFNTNIANGIWDALISGYNSDMSRAVSQYMAAGESKEEATKQYLRDFAEETWWDFFSGAVSGGASGGVIGGTNYIASRNAQLAIPQLAAQTQPQSEPSSITQGQTANTAEAENAAQTAQWSPVVLSAIEQLREKGEITNSVADNIRKDAAAVAELGISTEGKTASQLRAEIKTAISDIVRDEDTAAAEQTDPIVQANRQLFGTAVNANEAAPIPTVQEETASVADNAGQQAVRQRPVTERERVAAAKRILKNGIDGHDELRHSYAINGKQYMTNGYLAVVLDEPLQNIPSAQEDATAPGIFGRLDRLTGQENVKLEIPPLAELKSLYKSAKENHRGERGYKAYYDLGQGLPVVDLSYLIDVLTMMPESEAYFTGENKALKFTSDGATGYLMPVRNSEKSNAVNAAQVTQATQGQNTAQTEQTVQPVAQNNAATESTAQNTVGAAEAGFTVPGANRDTKYSKTRMVQPGNGFEQALGLTEDEYRAKLAYINKSERESVKEAEQLLYYDVDGEKTFIADIDPDGYDELMAVLESAPAWNGVYVDVGSQILLELEQRTRDGRATKREFDKFFDTFLEKKRASARGTQAGAKWSRAIASTSPTLRFSAIQNEVRRLADRLQMKEIPTISDDLEMAYLNAKTEAERDRVIDDITQYVADQIPSTFMDKFTSLRYLNMLGNMKTQSRNIVSNTIRGVVNIVRYNLSAGIERLTKIGKADKSTDRAVTMPSSELRKVAYNDFSLVESTTLNSANTKYSINEGLSDSDIQDKILGKRTIWKIGDRKQGAIGKGMEVYDEATQYAMDKGDVVFGRWSYTRALAGYLKGHGITAEQWESGEWQKNNQATVEKARSIAIREAQEATFREQRKITDWISKIGRRKDTHVVGRVLAEGVSPFRRTMTNILAQIEEHSPVGFVNVAVMQAQMAAYQKADQQMSAAVEQMNAAKTDEEIAQAKQALRAADIELRKHRRGEGITGTDIIDQSAKALTGTGLFLLGVWLASSGLLRSSPGDDKQKEYDDLLGAQDYAIMLPDGANYTIDWAAPVCTIMLMGAAFYEAVNRDGFQITDIAETLLKMADPLIETSMLQGLNDTIDNIKYSENAFFQILLNIAIGYLTQALTNTALGQVERMFEDKRMTTYIDKESWAPAWLQQTLGKISAKTPGWDYHQIPYINAWGEEESTGNVFERIVSNTISPGYGDRFEMDDTEAELQRLAEATLGNDYGGYSVFPKRADKSFDIGGDTQTLSAENYVKYATAKGQGSKKILDGIINSNAYDRMNDEEKAKCVSCAYEYANAKAKMQVSDYSPTGWVAKAISYGDDPSRYITGYVRSLFDDKAEQEANAAKKAEDRQRAIAAVSQFGISEKQFDSLDQNGNGTTTQDELWDFLSTRNDLDDASKAVVWATVGGWKTDYATYAKRKK